MEFLSGTERVKTIWGRLLLVVMFGSYILASFAHESPMPIGVGLILLVAIGTIYYIPLRFLYWVFTGSGEITNALLLWLPFVFMTLLGFALIFSPDTQMGGG